MSEFKVQPIQGAYTAEDFHGALVKRLAGMRPLIEGIDAERDNQTRAAFAAEAVNTYGARTGTGGSESIFLTISDLMGDLGHLLDAARALDEEHTDLDDLVARGSVHYEAEIRGEL